MPLPVLVMLNITFLFSFFKEKLIFSLSTDIISKMDESAFLERAFSWRGKNTLLRNLDIIEKNTKKITEETEGEDIC